MSLGQAKRTPTMAEVIRLSIEAAALGLHTSMPGIVETYDPKRGTVSVIPALKRKYADGQIIDLPEIPNVPLGFPKGTNFAMSWPIQKGDDVLVIFSERSLDIWKQQGGNGKTINPKDSRHHDLTDAIAIPNFTTLKSGRNLDPENVVIRHGEAKLKISEKGYSIGNATAELLAQVKALAAQVSSDVTALDAAITAITGPPPVLTPGAYDNIIASIGALEL